MAGNKVLSAIINKVLDQSLSSDIDIHSQYNPVKINTQGENLVRGYYYGTYYLSVLITNRNILANGNLALSKFVQQFRFVNFSKAITLTYTISSGLNNITFIKYDGTVVFQKIDDTPGSKSYSFIIDANSSVPSYYELNIQADRCTVQNFKMSYT